MPIGAQPPPAYILLKLSSTTTLLHAAGTSWYPVQVPGTGTAYVFLGVRAEAVEENGQGNNRARTHNRKYPTLHIAEMREYGRERGNQQQIETRSRITFFPLQQQQLYCVSNL